MENPRYIILETCPRVLRFINGQISLYFIKREDAWSRPQWDFVARKEGGTELILATVLYNRSALESVIHRTGFLLVEGSTEARLVEMLVARGHAKRVTRRSG